MGATIRSLSRNTHLSYDNKGQLSIRFTQSRHKERYFGNTMTKRVHEVLKLKLVNKGIRIVTGKIPRR